MGFTDAWAKYLEKDNIKVNGLCMGATDTPMLRGLFADHELPPEMAAVVLRPEQIADQMMELIESGRTGENVGAWVGGDGTDGAVERAAADEVNFARPGPSRIPGSGTVERSPQDVKLAIAINILDAKGRAEIISRIRSVDGKIRRPHREVAQQLESIASGYDENRSSAKPIVGRERVPTAGHEVVEAIPIHIADADSEA